MSVYLNGWNEYHVLLVMCLGMIAHAATVLRSWQQAARLGALVLATVVPAWFLSDAADRAFSLLLAWALCFGVGFAAAFRRSILPLVTAAGVIHYLLLTYYALYLSSRAAGVTLPVSIVVVGLSPGIVLAAGSLVGLLRRPWFRVTAYVGYLASLILLVLVRNPMEYLRQVYVAYGFSPGLYVVAFVTGGVALALCSHLIQLLLLIPPWERRGVRVVLDAVLGPSTVHQEQAGLMAARHLGGRMDGVGVVLLLAHGLLLLLNTRLAWLPPVVVIHVSVAALAWAVMPWEAWRRLRERADGAESSP